MSDLTSTLRAHFGFDTFRPGQQPAVESLLQNRHTLVVMPTGAGKSLIFQLAALQLPGLTLVISPLIALMQDQVAALARRGLSATYINSALPSGEQANRLENLAQGRYRIVYVAPERLRSAAFLQALRRQPLSLLAVDEAHCISEWGHDFRPDYLQIGAWRAVFDHPLTAALTATATPRVQADIVRLLEMGEAATRIVTGFNRPNLSLNVAYVNGLPDKLRALNRLLAPLRNDGSGAVIIYTGTRRDAEEAAEFAREAAGLPAEHYHAGLPAEQRARVQNDFISGKVNIIVATNAFGMGIDRADVRQVIHYALPGSLEAYYQEAGRAGRDGLPARATLLYDPQDRALHEFFIQQSELTESNLRAIHQAMREGEHWLTLDDLSRATGQHPVQARLALSALERAGALEHLGDEGFRAQFRKAAWNPAEIKQAIQRGQAHLKHRQNQLNGMAHYAESNTCRRAIILKHFGDIGDAQAADCCDNCRETAVSPAPGQVLGKSPEQMNPGERAALVILDCVRRLKINVGRTKMAQILHGSKARDILQFKYDKNVYYGRLNVVKQADIEGLIAQLTELGYLKVIGSKFPVIALTPRGEKAIREKAAIALKVPRSLDEATLRRAKAKLEAGDTLTYTARLFGEGLGPKQIAEERRLALTTVYLHLARLIAAGRISVEQVVPAEKLAKIEAAIQQVGSVEYLSPIKELLPDDIDYNLIRCVVAGHQSNLTPNTSSPDTSSPDLVESFLAQSHPRPLTGPWQTGWALGFHSRFSGGDWERSGLGGLTYRLKYEGDTSVLPELLAQTLALFRKQPELIEVDAILPVPPSQSRETDPVLAFCRALGQETGLTVQTSLAKARQTQPQKSLRTLAQKRANVTGAFALQGAVKGRRLLLVDDLFDSGATLEEITRLLLSRGAARVHVLTLTRTIHSDL